MEQQRLFLFFALGIVLILIWNAWQEDYVRGTAPSASTQREAPAPGAAVPGEAPGAPGGAPASTPARTGAEDGAVATEIRVVTDLLDVRIDTRGGTLRQALLRRHPVSNDDPSPFPLLHPTEPLFVAESGLKAQGASAPDHQTVFQAEAEEYRLAEGDDQVVVPLRWTSPEGITVVKRYVFRRDSYVVDLEQEVSNGAEAPWQAYQYVQLRRHSTADQGSIFEGRTYTGGVIYTPEDKYQKISFEDMAEEALSRDVQDGWVAFIQHYFLAAWVPDREHMQRFYTRVVDGREFLIGMSSPWQTVEPDQSARYHSRLFVGPKEQDRLEQVATGLELTVDYGILTVIAKPLFIGLSWIHGVVGNWGWAIVLLTLLIKIAFYKLSETSYRSMARMRKLQPRLQQLKERYGDDKQRMNQELMELYKREKVNPLGGCLPILIQIPVFIALYWVLLESVELRQADWVLWIDDLSTRDPYYVLPVIMGLTMFIQQRLNPAPMDPVQQKIMMGLPFIFTVFFLFFPAGLVLYWVTNNSLSILQQWLITRRIEAGAKE